MIEKLEAILSRLKSIETAVVVLSSKIDAQKFLLRTINLKEDNIMTTLSDVQAAVTAEDAVVDRAIALLQGLAAQVAALAPDQAAIDALAADITAKTQTLAVAVAAAAPAPTPAP